MFSYFSIRIVEQVKQCYCPSAVVVQCGADTLADDPMQSFNMTPSGLAKCIHHITSWKLPTLLLGGGGYRLPNTARCWANLTATVLGCRLPAEIPEHEVSDIIPLSYQLNHSFWSVLLISPKLDFFCQKAKMLPINPNSLDNKGSCWILKDFYCSVTMLRELGLRKWKGMLVMFEALHGVDSRK